MSQLIKKKNRQMYLDGANEHQCFGIRKLTIGAASVLLGTTLFLGGHTQEVHADTLNSSAPMGNHTSTGEEAASQELHNTSQDNVPTNPTVEQAKTPSTSISQSQTASVTSEAQSTNTQSTNTQSTNTQSTNTQSSNASQDQSATLNTYQAKQVAQSVNATPTVNSQVHNAPAQVHRQIPKANYTPTQASQDQSATLNTYHANQVASQVQSNTLNNNIANNTQKATASSRLANPVVQNHTNVNSVTNTSQTHLATNNTQNDVPNKLVNNKAKINYDALNTANKQVDLALNQPQALHAATLAMDAQNAVLRLSRNLKDVDKRQIKHIEDALMVQRNINPYLNFVSLASPGDDDVNISFPDDKNEDQKAKNQFFTLKPGEPYDPTQGVKTVTRNVEWYIIKANGATVPTGHTVIDTINFYEPQAKDDQGHLIPKYSWAHWNSSLDQHFRDLAREREQILKNNDNIRLDHVNGGTSADVAGETLITPDSPSQNIKVYFKEGKISTLIRFIDGDQDNGRTDGDQVVLSELSIDGPQGSNINDENQLREISDTLQNYLKQGFKVEDGGNPFSPQIDGGTHADSNAVEGGRVQYRPVDGAPDSTAINIMLYHDLKDFGGDQDTPNPKTGQKDKNTQKTVTRTISYFYDNGAPVMENHQPKKVVQPVPFSRMAHVDMVTGKVTYDDWGTPKSKSFSAVKTPQLAGYTPDQTIVPEKTVDATDPDSYVTVTYNNSAPRMEETSAQIQYIDDEDNDRVLKTDSLHGHVGDPINYSTQQVIKGFENQGYKLFSDNFDTKPHTFKDGDNNYEVQLVHNHEMFGGPQNTPNPKTGQKDKNTQAVVQRIISYVYDNGLPVMDTNNQPSKDIRGFTFSRQADVDMVTGYVKYASWGDATGTLVAVPSPALDGYTPDKAIVPEQTVHVTDPDIYVTVTYNKNAPVRKDASSQVNYIDDNNNGNVIQTGSLKGKVGDPINYSTQPTIKDLQNKGYELVSDNFGTTPHTFKDGNNNYEVHFKHSYETVKPGNEKTPGTPINPNDPNGPKWPNGTDKNSVERTGKRTINYTGANSQTPQPKVDTTNFTRQVVVDKVTGQITSATDWQPTSHQFDQVKTPLLDGYMPDKAIVPEQTVNATDPDINITVTYYTKAPYEGGGYVFDAIDAIGQVKYIDDNNNGNVIQTGSFNGKVGDPINYSTQPTIKGLKNKGYELVSDNFGTTLHTFKDGNNNYEVHFKHSYETVKPGNEKTPGTPINPNDPNGPKWPNGTDKNSVERTGKRTINYTGANSQTPQPKVDTTNFTRQVVVDKVTGQITNATAWQPTSHQFDQVKTPFINYFYADKLYAGNLSVSPSNLEATDLVTYQPMANIIPVDEGHHKIPNVPNPQYTTNQQDPTKAAPNQLVPSIQNMVPDQQTVTPINPGQPTEVIYRESKIPTKSKAARLIFKLNNTKTPNITDLHQIQSLPTMRTDGTAGSPMNDKTILNVYPVGSAGPGYGDTSKWRAIASANGVSLDAPAKAGYTWKIAKITGTDTSQDIYFVYSKAPDQSSLQVVVHDKTTNQDLPQYGYDHQDAPGTPVDYDWPTQKQHLIDNGYKIVNEPTVPSTIPDKPQTVTFNVEHDIVPDNNTDHQHTPGTPINPNNSNGPKWPAKDNFTKDYTYTVNFNAQNGNKVANPQHQVSTWNRTVYIDKVTGEIKPDQSTPWTPDKPNYGNTNVPVVNGYVANKTSKNGSPVSNLLPGPKTEQNNITDTVTYNTVGKIIPVDSNDKPIPGAEQPKYSNDPQDPTKVAPNEKVPALPGKTPRQTSVTPVNPTKDTHVIYDDNAVDTSLKVIVHDQTDNRDLTDYGFNSGTVKSGTRVPYTFDQDRQKLIDHGYEIVNVPAIPTVYGKTPQTVTITIKHAVAPVNNQDHKHTPGTPVNPNDSNGPKWPTKDNYSQDYTYTVNFSGPDGKQLAGSKRQTSTWNRTVYIDKVTGEIKPDQSTPWTPDKSNYGNTNVPVVNGYVANKTSKNGSPVSNLLPGPKTEQNNITDTVTYNTVGKIIPVDSNDKPIPGAEQPKYSNDPQDPTKVTPNEKVPALPGKTPRQTSVTPVNPTKDTHVIYDNNVGDTSLKVIVHDQTDNRDLTGYGFNSGTVKSGTRVPYTFNQDRQKLIDHGYEIVNVPAIPTVYSQKPQTVTITVKHAVAPVNNQDHKHTPGTQINPHDPNGPKWPAKDYYSQDHTYTVNFSGPEGKQLADPKTQTSHWNRTLNIDKVTGEILNPHEPWQSDITNYQDTKVPVINGYVAKTISKNGSPVSKILPGAKAVPSDITDTVQYGKIGRIIPVDPSGKPIPGASTPMYENDPDDPTKVKRTDVPYIKGYTPSVNSVDPKDPTKDTDVVYQKDQPDIVPDNPNENLPSVPNDSNNDLGNFKTPKKNAKKAPAKKAPSPIKQAPVNNNNAKQPVHNNNAKQPANNNNAGPVNNVKAPAAKVVQAATLPNKVVTKQAPANNTKKALPQTGEDQNDLMILAVGSLLGAMSLATLAGTRRKRKYE